MNRHFTKHPILRASPLVECDSRTVIALIPDASHHLTRPPFPRPDQTGDQAASAIRVGDLKLMKRYFPESLELYDLKKDPYEKTNLAESDPEIAEKLKIRLEKILTRFDSMEPRKNWKDKTVTTPLSIAKE